MEATQDSLIAPAEDSTFIFHISQFIIMGKQSSYTSSSLCSFLSLHQGLFVILMLTLIAAMCVHCYPYFTVANSLPG